MAERKAGNQNHPRKKTRACPECGSVEIIPIVHGIPTPALQKLIDEGKAIIADREREVKTLEAKMSEPGFYDDADAAKTSITRHQQLMWEVGDLMNQWEALQED